MKNNFQYDNQTQHELQKNRIIIFSIIILTFILALILFIKGLTQEPSGYFGDYYHKSEYDDFNINSIYHLRLFGPFGYIEVNSFSDGKPLDDERTYYFIQYGTDGYFTLLSIEDEYKYEGHYYTNSKNGKKCISIEGIQFYKK